MSITTYKADVDVQVTNKSLPYSIDNKEVGRLMKEAVDFFSGYLSKTGNTGNTVPLIVGSLDAYHLDVFTNNARRARIFATGGNGWLFGSGTTDSLYGVDVQGTTRFQQTVLVNPDWQLNFGSINAYLRANGSGVLTLHAFNGAFFNDGSGEFFRSFISSGSATASAINRFLVVGAQALEVCAAFEVKSSSRGLLLPRLTTTQRDAIGSTLNGLIIYNSTTDKFQGYAASTWVDFH